MADRVAAAKKNPAVKTSPEGEGRMSIAGILGLSRSSLIPTGTSLNDHKLRLFRGGENSKDGDTLFGCAFTLAMGADKKYFPADGEQEYLGV